ncbi:MAG: alpha/beta hydrolase [Myxococcota bacterium]
MTAAAPSVRFFKLPSGQRMAYSIAGSGPPLVCAAWWVSHVEADWEAPGFRRFFTRLAQRCTVVRYDRLGAGLSDREREPATMTLDEETAALSAVMDQCEFETAALLGVACAGPPAIAYAARQPDRVSKVVLWGSFMEGNQVGSSSIRDAVQGLVLTHWGMGSTALADLFAPGLGAEAREALAKQQRNAASAKMSAEMLALTFDMSVGDEAAKMDRPALVLHRRGDRAIPFAAGRELAASLPNAALKTLEGSEHVPWYGAVDEAADMILEFIVGEAAPEAAPTSAADRSLIRQGDLWVATYAGKSVHLKHARGLEDLALLLATPGEEVHAGTLYSGAEAPVRSDGAGTPMLDEPALRAYRERLEAIDEQLGSASMLGASDVAERLRSEREALAREIRSAVGLGGRARTLGDPSERARKAVTSRIRSSIKKISQVHAPLGEHLSATVSTGSFCSYGERTDEAWAVSPGQGG